MSSDVPAPSADTAWLEDEAGARIPLKRHFTVGRATANSLTLRDLQQRVSSYHARIDWDEGGRYLVEDRHSTNGTFVNERKVTRQELCDGDRIRFGSPAVYIFRGPQHGHVPDEAPGLVESTMRHYEERDCWFLIGDIKDSSRLASSLDGIALARLVSDWAARCRNVAERHGGVMTNRTGDGWLVLWSDAAGVVRSVGAALQSLRELQRAGVPAFRVLVHWGRATIAGAVRSGEDNVLSAELHQAFRMEKIAARLQQDMVASEAAAKRLEEVLSCRVLPGVFELSGFTGGHRFFEVAWEEANR
ncbi:MAG TPA: FHA domain-containing protein [Chthoniobacterales bacterium]|nr:FHA domain-containing protein [Chthoniobacterales bacterium]